VHINDLRSAQPYKRSLMRTGTQEALGGLVRCESGVCAYQGGIGGQIEGVHAWYAHMHAIPHPAASGFH
jgi:hypothetical protein